MEEICSGWVWPAAGSAAPLESASANYKCVEFVIVEVPPEGTGISCRESVMASWLGLTVKFIGHWWNMPLGPSLITYVAHASDVRYCTGRVTYALETDGPEFVHDLPPKLVQDNVLKNSAQFPGAWF